jgi:hypothetical protein
MGTGGAGDPPQAWTPANAVQTTKGPNSGDRPGGLSYQKAFYSGKRSCRGSGSQKLDKNPTAYTSSATALAA